jgi:hypothetical protein
MRNTWMRCGSGTAHWIKLAGGKQFITACGHTLAKNYAQVISTDLIPIGRPERFYDAPTDGDICPACVTLAKQAAT